MIGFDTLRDRLIRYIRHRIQNGEITERALAIRASISQPHLHNMLKGVRSLNPEMGDQLLAKLGLSVLDLIDSDELRRVLFVRTRESEPSSEVPVLRDRLGPGLPWPDRSSPFELVRVPLRLTAHIAHPLVVRLAQDTAMNGFLKAGELVLLDNSSQALNIVAADELFAVERNGAIALRWIRRGRAGVYLVSYVSRDQPRLWDLAPDAVIRARAILLRSIHKPEFLYDPLLPRDIPQEPVPLSAAS